jgi:hypothetical protein
VLLQQLLVAALLLFLVLDSVRVVLGATAIMVVLLLALVEMSTFGKHVNRCSLFVANAGSNPYKRWRPQNMGQQDTCAWLCFPGADHGGC